MENILEIKNLCKSYQINKKLKQEVLKEVSLNIKSGEFVSIVGASGSGKSTLLNSMSGMDTIDMGNILLDDEEITKLTQKELSRVRLQKMGFIFQNIHLLKNADIFDNIVLPAYRLKREGKDIINKRCWDLMRMMNIDSLANKDINQVSGGQLQRAAICRALINHPKIVFGDEPTGSLDSAASNDVLQILSTINKEHNTTILVVTHDMRVAAQSDRVLYMADGQIVSEKVLGKYGSKEDKKIRERVLIDWIEKLEQ